MTDQPRDLAAEVEHISLNPPTRFNPVCEWSVRSAATPGVESADDGYLVFRSAYASHTATFLEHIAALSRELEEHREALRWLMGADQVPVSDIQQQLYSITVEKLISESPAHLATILAGAMRSKP